MNFSEPKALKKLNDLKNITIKVYQTGGAGELVLKEHKDAKWLTKEALESVEWLPADCGLIEKLKTYL